MCDVWYLWVSVVVVVSVAMAVVVAGGIAEVRIKVVIRLNSWPVLTGL